MGNIIKNLFDNWGKQEKRILMIGLDAGKSDLHLHTSKKHSKIYFLSSFFDV